MNDFNINEISDYLSGIEGFVMVNYDYLKKKHIRVFLFSSIMQNIFQMEKLLASIIIYDYVIKLSILKLLNLQSNIFLQ